MEKDAITSYLDLSRDPMYGDYFRQSDVLPLVLEEETLRGWSAEHDQPLGVVFDNSPFYMVLRDLVAPAGGKAFAYARILHMGGKAGAVILPVWQGKTALLRHYRHSCRETLWELPRGYMNAGETLGGTAARELREELGVDPAAVRFTRLGGLRADSGILCAETDVYLAEFTVCPAQLRPDAAEGIQGVRWADRAELKRMCAAGELTDGFTLSALLLWLAAEN